MGLFVGPRKDNDRSMDGAARFGAIALTGSACGLYACTFAIDAGGRRAAMPSLPASSDATGFDGP